MQECNRAPRVLSKSTALPITSKVRVSQIACGRLCSSTACGICVVKYQPSRCSTGNGGKVVATVERVVADDCNTIGNSDRRQAGAVLEGICDNTHRVIAQGNGGDAAIAMDYPFAYVRNATFYLNQASAIVERTQADAGDAIGDGQIIPILETCQML